MNISKQKRIIIMTILFVAFLIEFPCRMAVISYLYFASPLNHIIIGIIFYTALFASFMIILKPNITSKLVLKTTLIVGGFLVFEEIISNFFYNLNFVLVYEIIRPVLIFGVIFALAHWVLKSKVNISKAFLVIASGIFTFRTVFIILEYLRAIFQSLHIEEESTLYLQSLTMSGSSYTILSGFSNYALTFVIFLFVQQKIAAGSNAEQS